MEQNKKISTESNIRFTSKPPALDSLYLFIMKPPHLLKSGPALPHMGLNFMYSPR